MLCPGRRHRSWRRWATTARHSSKTATLAVRLSRPLCRLLPITCSRSRKPRHRDSDTAPTRFSLSPPSRKIEGATTSYCCTQDPLGESEVMCGAELRGNASTHAPALVLKTLRSELGSPRPRSCAAEPRASRCCVYALLSGTHVIACVLLRSQARAFCLAGNGCRADSPGSLRLQVLL